MDDDDDGLDEGGDAGGWRQRQQLLLRLPPRHEHGHDGTRSGYRKAHLSAGAYGAPVAAGAGCDEPAQLL